MGDMFNELKAMVKIPKATVLGSAFPMKLTVGLTYHCQSRCNHCDLWKLYQHNPEGCTDEAQSAVFLKMLEDLRDNVLWLEFTGGEPFLRREIAEIASFALNSTGVVTAGIISNGLDRNLVINKVREILVKSKKKKLVIGISIDGCPETYERVRGLNGFATAMRTFLELERVASSSKNLRPHVAYTINHLNAGSFPDFYKLMSDEYGINIEQISFAVEHSFGYYFQNKSIKWKKTDSEFKKQTLNDIQFILGLRRNQKIKYANPLNTFYEYYLRNVSEYFRNPEQQIIPCKASEFSAYVDPYGYVYPCTMWNEVLGSLKKRDFMSIWRSAKRRKAMQIVRAGRCPNCWTPCEAQPNWFFNFGFLRGWW